ncbi:MAG: sensor histidine kinase, partial [Prevotella sp.]|nr:sensor histidine kinase [Prevotella sp.]
MNRNVFILLLSLLFSCATFAQGTEKSDLQQRAETADQSKNVPQARSLYIHAFNDYISKGQTTAGVECAVRATALYYKENLYKEAFELLRRVDQTIQSDKQLGDNKKAGLFYLSTKERMQMYLKLKKGESTKEQLNKMEILATRSADDATKNDLLYAKAIYYYTFGMNAQGNAVFKEMADKLTAAKDYDKVDEVYKTLIANGRRSNNASMVAQSYSNYIAWKDSTDAMKHADEINALKKQIADNEASIADKD